MQKGDIVTCVLAGDYGKPRPAVVIQSDLFNATHASITVCPITTHCVEAPLFRISIASTPQSGLTQTSQIMTDKMMSLRREKIHNKIGVLNHEQKDQLDQALKNWLQLGNAVF